MEYLQLPITKHNEMFYSRKNTNPHETLKFIRDGYVMLDVHDLTIIPNTVREFLKTHDKFILHHCDLEFLHEIDPLILHNMTHLVYDGNFLDEFIHEFESLKYLELTDIYYYKLQNTQNLLNKLPIGLEALVLVDWFEGDLSIEHLPITLKYLYIYRNVISNKIFDMLPINLEVLVIISDDFEQSLDNLPPNLKILKIQCKSFHQTLNNLPDSLEYLSVIAFSCHFPLKYTQLLTNLPSGLKYCILDHNMYYANKDSILAANPNCIISYDRDMKLISNVAKLFGVTVESEQLHQKHRKK